MGRHKTTKVTCINCSLEFQARDSDLRIGGGLFCSKACKNSGEHNPNYRAGGMTKYEYKVRAKAKNPIRFAAMQAVQTAVRKGLLIRQPCSVCGNVKSEGHHHDYGKPLEVEWLCKLHHLEKHHGQSGKRESRSLPVGVTTAREYFEKT